MSTLIHKRVALANAGDNPYAICKLKSGWLVIGDVQPLPGYCLLLADPVVGSINDLCDEERAQFSRDMYRIGDALMKVAGAFRVNYEILGNLDPALHAHILPRYMSEPEEKRCRQASWGYDWSQARKFDPVVDGPFVEKMREYFRVNDC